jgi:hypothetical protein
MNKEEFWDKWRLSMRGNSPKSLDEKKEEFMADLDKLLIANIKKVAQEYYSRNSVRNWAGDRM